MKSYKIYSLILVVYFTSAVNLFAQKNELQEVAVQDETLKKETEDLTFQTHFFEALKEKAINNYSNAIESLEKCYELDSNNLAVEFEFSKNYFKLKKYFEAELFIDKALSKEPKNEYLLYHKVDIFKAQHNYKKAIEVQKRLNEIKPKYSDRLVLLYLQNKEYDKAELLISELEEKALGTVKLRGYKRYLANKLKAKSGNLKTVKNSEVANDIKSLQKAYEANKEYAILVKLLNEELKMELFELAYNDSKNGLELFPSQPFLYYINGLSLNKLTKYNEAIAVLTIGIDFVFDEEMEAKYYEQLALAYEGLKNTEEALKFKQKAEKLRLKN